MEHNKAIDDVMDEVKQELDDAKIVRYKFMRNGFGSSKELSISQQSEMAQELMEFINTFGGDVWSNN